MSAMMFSGVNSSVMRGRKAEGLDQKFSMSRDIISYDPEAEICNLI